MTAGVVIVGAGQAGLQVASSLREGGYRGSIRMIGDETHPPYQRPPLSKSYLSGEAAETLLFMQEPDYFGQHGIEFIGDTTVTAIDRDNRRVDLTVGDPLEYDHLVLATGTRNRALPCVEGEMAGVLSIRTLDDSRRLKSALAGARNVIVIGAGFLGLEAAAIAIKAGIEVEVLEMGTTALGRVVSPLMSAAFRRRHEETGIRFRFGEAVVAIHGDGARVHAVEVRDGGRIEADLVFVAIGVIPNSELAGAAGLAVHDGIVVDKQLLTDDPAISAIGDCASFPFAADGGRMVRLESVQNAVDQARGVAERILGGDIAYDQVPIFWSDQAGLRLQIAGITRPGDASVARGDPGSTSFSVFRYRGDRLVAVESVNRLPDHMQARKLLKAGISPTIEQAADTTFDLKSLLTAPAAVA